MSVTLMYFGPQWAGSTSLQRLQAFQQLEGIKVVGVDNGSIVGKNPLWARVRWKLRLPIDTLDENRHLLAAAEQFSPEIVLVDNSKVIKRRTLARLREMGVSRLVYYSPDDIVARHNLSLPLKWSLPDWDIVCTTKTFNIAELTELNVRRPFLIGKAYDPKLHRPLSSVDVGPDFESFDVAFIGTYEPERCASINMLAENGVSVVVYGADKGRWKRSQLHPAIELRNSVFSEEYVRAWHVGKVALCFLRKANRDRITQRTMEIAAIGRPMVAERTEEHNQHFTDGCEYLGFSSDQEMLSQVRRLLGDGIHRLTLGKAGRERCLRSGYSTHDRAQQMIKAFLAL